MELKIESEDDSLKAVIKIKLLAEQMGFSDVMQTMIMTSVSEIAHNMYFHVGKGFLKINEITDGSKKGIEIIAEDEGPGIKNVDQALTDYYSTKGSLGMGMSGAKRLMDEFIVENKKPNGLRVTMKKWI